MFTTGIKHANNACAILLEMGVSAVCVHTAMEGGDAARDAAIAAFRRGEIRAMIGVGVFGVGFDCPEVDCIVMLRPTMSVRIHVQYLGRGLRPHPSKTSTLVLDFARNTERLGCINDPCIPKKRGKGNGMVPFRVCPECATYNHTRTLFCTCCGYEFPISFKGTQKASDAELIRRTPILPPKLPKPPKPPALPAAVETYRVDRIECAKHASRDPDKALSMRVSYICGLRIFSEWWCLEHEKGFPRHKARNLWRELATTEPPDTVDEAIQRSQELRIPTEIRVLHGKYDEVVGHSFSVLEEILDDVPF